MEKSRSSSGFTEADGIGVSKEFSSFHELPSEGFCRIVKARRYGRWYVLKSLKEEYAGQSMYRQLLVKEFEIGIRLSHKNIVSFVGWETVEGYGECIVQEYVEGVSLKEFLTERTRKNIRRKLAGELLEAVAYMNAQQIVHRDLKPSNMMVTSNGNNLKIIDFGLSDTDDYAVLKEPAGSEKYMSPEQKATCVPDCRNDVYSVGVILKMMDAGHDYDAVAKKCLMDIDHRYMNLNEAAESLVRKKRIRRAAGWIAAVMVMAGICSYAVIQANQGKAVQEKLQQAEDKYQQLLSEEEQKEKIITERIREGEALSDRLMAELIAFIDKTGPENWDITNTEKHVSAYNEYSKRIQNWHSIVQQAVDSLTSDCSNTDRITISQSIMKHHSDNSTVVINAFAEKIQRE